jgi:hypothetical protein
MTDQSERQARLEELVGQGYSQGEAEGRIRAEDAGFQPLPSHGVDDTPGTIGFDRVARLVP